MDRLSKEQRRRTMQAVKSKDTKIEKRLRSALWKRGYRFRKNYPKLIGKPDIVFPSLKIVVFCDSDFWHGYDWKDKKHEIKSNKAFWHKKIEGNMRRDKKVTKTLRKEGLTVIRLWGHSIENNLEGCVNRITKAIEGKRRSQWQNKNS